jgi:transmembrane protein TMEM260 (protein O-mannosyltransferase)
MLGCLVGHGGEIIHQSRGDGKSTTGLAIKFLDNLPDRAKTFLAGHLIDGFLRWVVECDIVQRVRRASSLSSDKKNDLLVTAVIFIATLVVYVRTLAPSVASIFDDTLEIQYVVPRLGILHQTGYPLYTLLGKLFTLIFRVGDAAYRLNLFSAITAACAVALLYLVIRQLTAHRIPAVVGALTFAFGPTFWDQSNAAEVYALQMLISAIIMYAALSWGNEPSKSKFYVLALVMGLGLAHHRLTLLIYPAIAVYVLLILFRREGTIAGDARVKGVTTGALNVPILVRSVVLFLSPLLLYLYLPLRADVGSADGLYQNTPVGFFDWIMASRYVDFLTQDPLGVQHDFAFYLSLFTQQFTVVGLLLAAIGFIWLARKPREWVMLAAALVAVSAFASSYRTADVQVHFLTTFFLLAILLGIGADAFLNALSSPRLLAQVALGKFKILDYPMRFTFYLVSILLLIVPAQLLSTNYPLNDLSSKWDVHDYGIDLLSQPLENNATIIGILGEMTLVRYVQDNYGLRPDVQTVPADREADRLSAIDKALAQNRTVYLTRPLKGVTENYSLSSLGPLIRVQPQPATDMPNVSNPLIVDFGAMELIGFDVDASRLVAIPTRWHAENGEVVRVTVYWRVDEAISTDAMVSVKILNKDRRVVGQIDHRPVLDAYPTSAWRPGQVIVDTYDVPIFLGAAPGEYAINATIYDAGSGAVIGSHDLKAISLAPDFVVPRREVWNIAQVINTDFGAFALIGYSLDSDTAARPGDALSLTLLWRASLTKISDSLKVRLWLEDEEGKSVASRDAPLGSSFPSVLWQAGQYVRDFPMIRLPANVSDGRYHVKLAVVRGDQLLGFTPLSPSIAALGELTVKNRARVATAPPTIAHSLEATFDNKIRLLGYDFSFDSSRNARLTLYWKPLALIDTPYTVFVHVLDSRNQVIASGDAVPGNGEFPTTGWVESEYIVDVHSFGIPSELPSGIYQIEIGWYDPITNTRLKMSDGRDRVLIAPIDIP